MSVNVHALLLVGVVLLGLALRLYGLGEVPYGFHPDEGHKGVDALAILDGWRPAFLPRDNGREPLFMYLIAVNVALFGPTVWAARLTGALGGTLIILAQYLLVRSLPLPRPRLTALVSAAVLAVTFWPISISHQAMRTGFFPFWVILFVWAWWKALQLEDSQWRGMAWAGVAGVFLAAANYTHMMGRVLPFVMLVSALWAARQEKRLRPLAAFPVALGVGVALLIPMIRFFLDAPEMLTYRADQISVLNAEINKGNLVGTLTEQAGKIALAFTTRGSTTWTENLPGRPIFDPLVGFAFLAGLGLLLRDLVGRRGRAPQSAALLLLATFVGMLVPTWLSAGAPNYGRMTGAWPALFLLPAWALVAGHNWLATRGLKWLGVVGLIAVITLSGAWAAYDFFVTYADNPRSSGTFNSAGVERAKHINALLAERPTYLSSTIWNQAVMRYLTSRGKPGVFDLTAGLALPPEGDVAYAFEGSENEAADAFAQRWPMMTREDLINRYGQLSLIAFRLDRAQWPSPVPFSARSEAIFGDNIQLLGYVAQPDRPAPGRPLTVSLEWQALAPTALDHNLFIHIVSRDGRTVAQYDGSPLGGSYGTHLWKPGEHILQSHRLTVARDAPAGPATLRVGWYNWRDGQRLPVAGDADAAVELGTVEIGAPP